LPTGSGNMTPTYGGGQRWSEIRATKSNGSRRMLTNPISGTKFNLSNELDSSLTLTSVRLDEYFVSNVDFGHELLFLLLGLDFSNNWQH
jgi:hypothetical protein